MTDNQWLDTMTSMLARRDLLISQLATLHITSLQHDALCLNSDCAEGNKLWDQRELALETLIELQAEIISHEADRPAPGTVLLPPPRRLH